MTNNDLERRKNMTLSILIKEDSFWMQQFVRPCILNDNNFERLKPYIDRGLMKLGYSFVKKLSTVRIRSKWLCMFGIDKSLRRKDVPYQIISLVDEQNEIVVYSLSQYIYKIWSDAQSGVCKEYTIRPITCVK